MNTNNLNRNNTIKALLSYTHTPKEYLKEIINCDDKKLLFHLENFCLICGDDYNDVLIKYNCINKIK